MQKFNLHTHSNYCDGKAAPEEVVKAAIEKGLHTLGFSSHSPIPFRNKFAVSEEDLQKYCREIDELKQKYRDQINIFKGLEIDYIPGDTESFDSFRKRCALDFTIGGVHLVKNHHTGRTWFIDGPSYEVYDKGLERLFGGDVRFAITSYYEQLREMIIREKPDIVAHLDKIKMHNRGRHFNENDKWVVKQEEETLEVIKQHNTIVEVNTRAKYKGRAESFFPDRPLLEKIHRLGIPVTVSTDAHTPSELDSYFDEAIEILKDVGLKEVYCLERRDVWKSLKLS